MSDSPIQRLEALIQAHGLSAAAAQDLRVWARESLAGSETLAPELRSTLFESEALPADLEPASEVAPRARFVLIERVGRGGMGEVWRAFDQDLGREIALKMLRARYAGSASTLARFVEEARLTARLAHPGVVPVHELGRLPDGRWFFTMEMIAGRTMAERLPAPPSEQDALVAALLSVCEVVAHAHAQGVIHRDLKPDNVMLGSDGAVLVMDWGIAKVPGRAEPPSGPGAPGPQRNETQDGAVLGTPAFMAPEQAFGRADVSPRADIYSLGAILYTILVGQPPYVDQPGASALEQVLAGPPVPVTGPPALVDLCQHAMARDPADRPAAVAVLAQALRGWLSREGPPPAR